MTDHAAPAPSPRTPFSDDLILELTEAVKAVSRDQTAHVSVDLHRDPSDVVIQLDGEWCLSALVVALAEVQKHVLQHPICPAPPPLPDYRDCDGVTIKIGDLVNGAGFFGFDYIGRCVASPHPDVLLAVRWEHSGLGVFNREEAKFLQIVPQGTINGPAAAANWTAFAERVRAQIKVQTDDRLYHDYINDGLRI